MRESPTLFGIMTGSIAKHDGPIAQLKAFIAPGYFAMTDVIERKIHKEAAALAEKAVGVSADQGIIQSQRGLPPKQVPPKPKGMSGDEVAINVITTDATSRMRELTGQKMDSVRNIATISDILSIIVPAVLGVTITRQIEGSDAFASLAGAATFFFTKGILNIVPYALTRLMAQSVLPRDFDH